MNREKINNAIAAMKNVDMFYEMSDSHSVWASGTACVKKTREILKELTPDELQIAVEEYDNPEKWVRYFDNILEEAGIRVDPSDDYKKNFYGHWRTI